VGPETIAELTKSAVANRGVVNLNGEILFLKRNLKK
jgi:hypothetical protein